MAARKDATVVIEGNTTSFNAAMRDAARAIQIANAEFKKATAGLDKWGDSADGVRAKLKQLQDILKQENNKLSALKQNYEQMAKKYGETSDKAQELTVRIKKQEAQIAKTQAEINKYSTQLSAMEDAEKEAAEGNEKLANSFDDVAKKSSDAKTGLEKFGSYLEKGVTGAAKAAGKAILAIGTAAVGAGAASVKAGMSFDEQMSTVKAISGATEEEFEQLRKKALEMGSTTKFTATESGKALEYMGMAGWKAQDMLEGLPGIINAAAASGEDLGTVSDIITDGLTAFGLQAEDSSHFADVLAAASANANTNITLMGDTFKYVAPVAGALKYSIDDVAMGVGLMANAGIKADQAGTSLRSMLSRMAAPTKNVAAAMEELGISMSDDEGNMKSFDELVNQLRESFSKLTEQEKAKYANDIAGKTAMSGMLAIVNSSTEDYNKLTDAIKGADGAAKEMADTRLDNLQGDVTIFKSALEGAAISISDQMAPALREFVQEGTEMIPELSGDIAELGGELAGVATGLMPIIQDAVKALVPIAKEIMGVIKDILPYLSEIFQSLLPVAEKLIGSIVKIVKPLVDNILPPLTRFIGEIAKVLEPILDILTPIFEVIAKIHSLIIGGLLDAWSTLLGVFTGTNDELFDLKKQFSELSDAEKEVVDRTKEITEEQKNLKDSLKQGFEDIDKSQGVYDRMREKLDNITDGSGKVKKGYEDLAQYIVDKFNSDYGTQIEIVDGVIQKYDEEIKKIDDLIAKKRAMAYLDSAEDEYSTATENRKTYAGDLVKSQAALRNAQAERKDLESQRLMAENVAAVNGMEFDAASWNAKIEGVDIKIRQLNDTISETKDNIARNETVIANFDKLEQAIAENDVPKMTQAMQDFKEGFIDAKNGTEKLLEEQTAKFKRQLIEMKRAAETEGSGITQEMVNQAQDMYIRSAREWQKLSGMTDEELTNVLYVITGRNGIFGDAGEQLGENVGNGISQGLYNAAQSIYNTAQGIADNISSIMSNITASVNVTTKGSPKTATGGIVTKAQTRIVGEDGAEAIVPLEKNTGWIDAVAQKVVLSMGGAGTHMQNVTNNYNFNQTNNSPKALSRLEIYRQSRNLLNFKA